jgi:hypothetical protein
MPPRFPKRSIAITAFLAGSVLICAALAPAAAQQTSAIDGQVALRSDGAVYLISNGQRRWVATVAITDEELNAYPEGEPIYAGLAPMGSQTAAGPESPSTSPAATNSSPGTTIASKTSAAPKTTVASKTTAASNPPAPGPATSTNGAITPQAIGTPTGAVSEIDPEVPIEVDVDGTPKFEVGEVVTVNVKTKAGATCELAVAWPDGTEANQQSMAADSQGRCEYEIDVPASATVGVATLKGVAREGGRTSRQSVEFEIIPSS